MWSAHGLRLCRHLVEGATTCWGIVDQVLRATSARMLHSASPHHTHPQFVSEASLRAPEEVHASTARGEPRAEEELSREERKRRRAQKKRAGKKRRASKEEERAMRAAAAGGTVPLTGRKSEAAAILAARAKKGKKGGPKGAGTAPAAKARGHYTKSAAVFAQIQNLRDAKGTGAPVAASGPSGKALKL